MIFWKRSNRSKPPAEPTTIKPAETEELGPLGVLRQKIRKADLPEYVADQAETELRKLEKIDSVSSEYTIGMNYIELLLALPWLAFSNDNLDIERAESIFTQYHFGLDEIKNRILDFLAAKTLRSLASPKMLIVDDEPIALENMSYFFKKQGFVVEVAGDGSSQDGSSGYQRHNDYRIRYSAQRRRCDTPGSNPLFCQACELG